MANKLIYIAACVFTREHPELSLKVQNYVREALNADIIRCCVEKYKVTEFEDLMKEDIKEGWKGIPHYKPFEADDIMVYACHNCSAIFEENQQDIQRMSLWELILKDENFIYKDFKNEKVTIQDCWRSYDNRAEQDAVREVLKRMNIDIVELEENHEKTQFCGISTLQPTPKRNLIKAPIRYVQNAQGKFEPHSEEEKQDAMITHGEKITTEKVISYCHYCHKGLKMTGKDAFLLAELLFN